jgi:hypothetical protein
LIPSTAKRKKKKKPQNILFWLMVLEAWKYNSSTLHLLTFWGMPGLFRSLKEEGQAQTTPTRPHLPALGIKVPTHSKIPTTEPRLLERRVLG